MATRTVADSEPGRLELHIGRLTLGRRECDRHLGVTLERRPGQRRPGREICNRRRELAARQAGGQRIVQLACNAAAPRGEAQARQADDIGGSGEACLQPRFDALRRAGEKGRGAELALRMVEITKIERRQPDLGRELLGQEPVGADPLPLEIVFSAGRALGIELAGERQPALKPRAERRSQIGQPVAARS
jgi:hypothetical protein